MEKAHLDLPKINTGEGCHILKTASLLWITTHCCSYCASFCSHCSDIWAWEPLCSLCCILCGWSSWLQSALLGFCWSTFRRDDRQVYKWMQRQVSRRNKQSDLAGNRVRKAKDDLELNLERDVKGLEGMPSKPWSLPGKPFFRNPWPLKTEGKFGKMKTYLMV